VLRYIQAIKDFGLMYERNEKKDVELFNFCDSDWAGSMNDMKYIRIYIYTRIRSILVGLEEVRESDAFLHRSRVCIGK
jgi:hypothetical protein